MTHATSLLKKVMPGEIEPDEALWLVRPGQHPPLLARQRAAMIASRVRLFALMFAICTPVWIVADYFTFSSPIFTELAVLRLAATTAFVWLVVDFPVRATRRNAYRAMALMFMIPTVFYVLSYRSIGAAHMGGLAGALAAGYGFLPFVLLCGLAIFPLSLVENLVFASPILLAHVASGLFLADTVDWPGFVGALWLMMLISGVTLCAGISQLAFMIALVRQAIRDPLTGAFTRRSGEEVLDMQSVIAYRAGAPLSVAFVDLDHFKAVNDGFGHDAGDAVLKSTAQAISTRLRRGDVLVRWGGEEFLVVMPNTTTEHAAEVVGRLREAGFGRRPDGGPVTASIGIAGRLTDQRDDWRDLVELADRRMYAAKDAGRDRIVAAEA